MTDLPVDPNATTADIVTNDDNMMPVVEPSQEHSLEIAVKAELQDHLRLAKQYQELIENAQTETKKAYYHKKLRKNNQKAFQMLIALQRLKNSRKKDDTQS